LALLLDTFNNNKNDDDDDDDDNNNNNNYYFNSYLPIISHRSYEKQKHTSKSTFIINTY